jgi:hypothetical protein
MWVLAYSCVGYCSTGTVSYFYQCCILLSLFSFFVNSRLIILSCISIEICCRLFCIEGVLVQVNVIG